MNAPVNRLTEGPIAKTMFFFTLPILLGNVLQSLNASIKHRHHSKEAYARAYDAFGLDDVFFS